MSENGCRVFPIITNAVQKEYEKCSMNTKSSDRTPEICGYPEQQNRQALYAAWRLALH